MIYRKLSPTGDYALGNGADNFYTGATAVSQAIFTTLKLFQGEWWEDVNAGFPLLQNVIGISGTAQHLHGADMLVQESILSVQGVQSVENFSSTFIDRKYTFNADVNTIYGTIGLKEVVF